MLKLPIHCCLRVNVSSSGDLMADGDEMVAWPCGVARFNCTIPLSSAGWKGKGGRKPCPNMLWFSSTKARKGGREGDGQTQPKRAAVRLDGGRGETEKRNRAQTQPERTCGLALNNWGQRQGEDKGFSKFSWHCLNKPRHRDVTSRDHVTCLA